MAELMKCMSDAWSFVQQNIAIAQSKHKRKYDADRGDTSLKVGDRVMPGEIKGYGWKFSCPFHGHYHILSIIPTNVEVRLVDQPDASSIFVLLN